MNENRVLHRVFVEYKGKTYLGPEYTYKDIFEKMKKVSFNRNKDERFAGGLWDLSMFLHNNISSDSQEETYNNLWKDGLLFLENKIEELVLHKRLSIDELNDKISKFLGYTFNFKPATWDETMGIDKSLIGGIYDEESDFYPIDIEIYYLDTYGYNKELFITEIVIHEN